MILTFLLKQWKIIAMIILSISLFIVASKYNSAKKEVTRQTANVKVLNSNCKSYKVAYKTGLRTIHGKDSTNVLNAAKIQALTYTVDEYKTYAKQDGQLIESMKLSLRTAQSASNISTKTVISTVIQLKDSCFSKKTTWQDVYGCILKGNITIRTTNTDSLLAVISTASKHNFLFFHWGDKITSLDVASKNPDTEITDVKFIVIKH